MTIKAQEKQARNHIEQYERSADTDIYSAYARPSIYKERAWRRWADDCIANCGWGCKVISHNTNMFTMGYLFCGEDGATKFKYITPSYSIVIDY